jgi:hypothetical protein
MTEDTAMDVDELATDTTVTADSDHEDVDLDSTQVTNSDEEAGSKSAEDDDDDCDNRCYLLYILKYFSVSYVHILVSVSSDRFNCLHSAANIWFF